MKINNTFSSLNNLKRNRILSLGTISTKSSTNKQNLAQNSNKKTKCQPYKKLIVFSTIATALIAGIIGRKKISQLFQNTITSTTSKQAEIKKPEFLYHITSKECFNSIMNDGIIKTSRFDSSVFMTDLNNLQNKTPKNSVLRMINYYDGGSILNPSPHRHNGSVIVLKIPVNELNQNLLGFRRIPLAGQDNASISTEIIPFSNYLSESSRELMEKSLEFLYRDEIPVNKISKIYEINTSNIESNAFLKDFFRQLKQ